MCVFVCDRACVRARVRAYVRACVRACVRICACVRESAHAHLGGVRCSICIVSMVVRVRVCAYVRARVHVYVSACSDVTMRASSRASTRMCARVHADETQRNAINSRGKKPAILAQPLSMIRKSLFSVGLQ